MLLFGWYRRLVRGGITSTKAGLNLTKIHKLILYGSLVLLSISLIIPGVMLMFNQQLGHPGLMVQTLDGRNQLRALYGMMTGIGLIALWACFQLERSRSLVMALGIIMALLVVARLYSIVVDGRPGLVTLSYLGVELLLTAVFLIWPPTD
jgi:Domain of unknown function (DUF4345)